VGCELEVSSDDDVAEGDLIQTSGVDDLFPKGRPIGAVINVERRNDRQVVSVQPAVRFDRLDAVFVVLAPEPATLTKAATNHGAAAGIQPIR
jgi:rod shape-determining protein MreC